MIRNISYITFVRHRELPVLFKSVSWYDALRWKLVKLLGGYNPNDSVKVERIPVDGETFMEQLFKQRRALTDQFNRETEEVLVGAEDYEELMNCKNVVQYFNFQSKFMNLGIIQGVKIRVVPWMRGILVMPKNK